MKNQAEKEGIGGWSFCSAEGVVNLIRGRVVNLTVFSSIY
jgi:hypothetical protein